MEKFNSSMQLTRGADYATRVMLYLASLPARERVFLPMLAKATGAPESFLSKVLQSLAHAQLIDSRRGQSGGFEILPKGRQASMLDVIVAVDGPLYLNVCLISGDACAREKWCVAHPVWVKAQQAMLDVLSSAVIGEMALESAAKATSADSSVVELKVTGR
jgi:Rrf2 family protein